jgi:PST family polysaccharide transporter
VTGIKERALRGGLAKALAQAASFVLKIGSTAILARLLEPRDFGLVGMVAAVTGVLVLLKDAGLSLPTVQRQSITDEQLSTLFWLNVLAGLVLTAVCAGLAPAVAGFYHDSRLVSVTLATAPSFLLSALGVQHNAILMRRMDFSIQALIDVVSLFVSSLVGIIMAWFGWGYWSLVGMSLTQPAVTTVGAWLAARWVPGGVHFDSELRSIFRLGGALTLNSIIVYVAYNTDKLLLGRYWGADALGSYLRAYTLVNIPTESLNSSVGSVALSGLSRLQNNPERLKAFFLKGYSLVVALTVPITAACVVFAEEIVAVVLGPKWGESAVIVRLLAPTVLVFGLINPTFWLIFSSGLMRRSVYMAVVIAVLVISSYALGLPRGPRGVATAYSLAMLAWLLPHIAWCVHGMSIRVTDIVRAAARPITAGVVTAIACLALKASGTMPLLPLARLLEGGCVLAAVYMIVLLYFMRQLPFYMDLIRSLFPRQTPAGSPTT